MMVGIYDPPPPSSYKDVIKTTILLTDIANFSTVNRDIHYTWVTWIHLDRDGSP